MLLSVVNSSTLLLHDFTDKFHLILLCLALYNCLRSLIPFVDIAGEIKLEQKTCILRMD